MSHNLDILSLQQKINKNRRKIWKIFLFIFMKRNLYPTFSETIRMFSDTFYSVLWNKQWYCSPQLLVLITSLLKWTQCHSCSIIGQSSTHGSHEYSWTSSLSAFAAIPTRKKMAEWLFLRSFLAYQLRGG